MAVSYLSMSLGIDKQGDERLIRMIRRIVFYQLMKLEFRNQFLSG